MNFKLLPSQRERLIYRSHRPDVIPGLEHGQQGHVIREATAGEVSVHEAETFAFADERLREAGGR